MAGEAVPHGVTWLVRMLVPRELREEFSGDLDEGYVRTQRQRGRVAAYCWALRQVSPPRLLRLRRETRRSSRGGKSGFPGSPGPSGGPGASGWLQDVRQGFRAIRLRPSASLAVMATIALAIGTSTAVFTVVNGVLLAPLPYPEPDRLVRALQIKRSWIDSPNSGLRGYAFNFPLSMPTFTDWLDADLGFASLGAYQTRAFVLQTPDGAEVVRGQEATSGVFDTLGVAPQLGRALQPQDDVLGAPPVAVLSHGLWQDMYGGEPDVVGRSITLSRVEYQIVGVMPPRFAAPEDTPRLWAQFLDEAKSDARNSSFLAVVARLADGVTMAEASDRLVALQEDLARRFPDASGDVGGRILGMLDEKVADTRPTLLFLFAAVGLVLLVSALNVTGLLSAVQLGRRRELAVKAALGAGSRRLVRGLAIETGVLATLGGILGIALAVMALPALLSVIPSTVPRKEGISVDLFVLGFGLGLTFVTSLLVGIASAWQARRTAPRDTLRAGGRGATGDAAGNRIRSVLVVVEVALAFTLLSGAGLLGTSFARLWSVERGFRPEGLVLLTVLPDPGEYPEVEDQRRFLGAAREALEAIPGATVTAGNQVPLSGSMSTTTWYIERSEGAQEQAALMNSVVLDNYFDVMEVPVRQGRGFEVTDDENAPLVAVVNEALARQYWPGEPAVGKRLRTDEDEPWTTVIGVAGDVRHTSLDTESEAKIYVPVPQNRRYASRLVMRVDGDLASAVSHARSALAGISAATPISRIEVLQERIEESVAVPRFRTAFVVGLAATAAFLALLGIFSVVSLTVGQRTREIGVRMALGAQAQQVLLGVLASSARLAAAGVLIGIALAVPATRLVQEFMFETDPQSPLPYAVIATVVLLLSAGAAFLPARRAASVDPVAALNSDWRARDCGGPAWGQGG